MTITIVLPQLLQASTKRPQSQLLQLQQLQQLSQLQHLQQLVQLQHLQQLLQLQHLQQLLQLLQKPQRTHQFPELRLDR